MEHSDVIQEKSIMKKIIAFLLVIGAAVASPLIAKAADSCCQGGTAPCCQHQADCCKK
jgi:hypothetical protein